MSLASFALKGRKAIEYIALAVSPVVRHKQELTTLEFNSFLDARVQLLVTILPSDCNLNSQYSVQWWECIRFARSDLRCSPTRERQERRKANWGGITEHSSSAQSCPVRSGDRMASSVFEGDVKKNLLERTEAEKVFRPWWDTLEDYLLNILIVLGQ